MAIAKVLLTPKYGNRKNPLARVPATAPSVLTPYKKSYNFV